MRAAIVDLGLGNIQSIENWLLRCDVDRVDRLRIATDADLPADVLVLPGVSNSVTMLSRLKKYGFDKTFFETHDFGLVICICGGMQVLCNSIRESGHTVDGLGIIHADCIPVVNRTLSQLTGWRRLRLDCSDLNLSETINDDFYFNHACGVYPLSSGFDSTSWHIDGEDWSSCVKVGSKLFGFQFHPEKSGNAGENLFKALVTNV